MKWRPWWRTKAYSILVLSGWHHGSWGTLRSIRCALIHMHFYHPQFYKIIFTPHKSDYFLFWNRLSDIFSCSPVSHSVRPQSACGGVVHGSQWFIWVQWALSLAGGEYSAAPRPGVEWLWLMWPIHPPSNPQLRCFHLWPAFFYCKPDRTDT